ncbi:hypothetical protein GCM10008106_26680 [Mongoliitalea lutea]|uniref:Uncharacterized protein n=2 Tax=Mongoliitalea lutea TaxID=849756 RepID=A0A8J3D115_9BACT|nr:hypothetical protein GCM10008106_26680 [Mongoliitalea lutea]
MSFMVLTSCAGLIKQVETTAPKYFDFVYNDTPGIAKCSDGKLRALIEQNTNGVWLVEGVKKDKGYWVAAPILKIKDTTLSPEEENADRIYLPPGSFKVHKLEKN